MILIWGSNFSIVKVALQDFPEIAFNAMRLIVGTAVYLAFIFGGELRARVYALGRKDWIELLFLGSFGTFFYQFCFVSAVKRTSVGNGSLIIGITPIAISLLSAVAGHERIKPMRWAGVALATLGLYLVVARGVNFSGTSWRGDLLMFCSVICWSVYSVASQSILKRHPPLFVIGLTFSIGAMLYVTSMVPFLTSTNWAAISSRSWLLMFLSATLALNLSYWIWYTGLQKLGGSRTSIYSYLTPIVAMIVAAIWIGEPITGNQIAGAGAIFAGLLITRFVN